MSEAGFNKSFHTLLKISIICIFLLANIGFGLLTVDSSESQPTSPYGFTVRSDYPVLNGPGAIFVADIDADSDLDIITSNKYNNTISIRKNNGSGIFNTTSNYYVSDSPMGLQITDLGEDGNNDLDIMVCGYDANKVTILFNNGTGGFDDSVNYEIEDSKDPGPVDLYAADIDNDGDQDLAVCNHWAHSISIFKNKGNGIFSKNVNYEVNDRPYSVFLADIDQDQYSDLITVHYLDSAISVLINDGTGKFGNGFNLPVDAGPHDVWVTDIDNDFRMKGTIVRTDINNDFRTQSNIVRTDITNDFRMQGATLIDIINDF